MAAALEAVTLNEVIPSSPTGPEVHGSRGPRPPGRLQVYPATAKYNGPVMSFYDSPWDLPLELAQVIIDWAGGIHRTSIL